MAPIPQDLGTALLNAFGGHNAFGVLLDMLALVSFAIPTVVRGAKIPFAKALPYLGVFSLVLGIVSISTGLANNGTDEPYAAAQWLGVVLAGHNPYVYPVTTTYTQFQLYPPPYFQTLHSTAPFVYLPVSMLFVIPGGGTGFKFFALSAWAGTLYLLRKQPWGALVWASPIMALLAAQGFNDPLPIFFLTLALVPPLPRTASKASEYAALGMKQFAPVVMVIYYFARRKWVHIGLTLLVTFLILLPFVLWGPASEVLCTGFLLPTHSCPSSYPLPESLYVHWNYYLWPVWLGALFGPRLFRWARGPEGLPHFSWASARIRTSREGRLRRSRQVGALLLAYLHWWFHPLLGRRTVRASAGAGEPLRAVLPEEDPFGDWPPR